MRRTQPPSAHELDHIHRSVRLLQRACEHWFDRHARSLPQASTDHATQDMSVDLRPGNTPPTPDQMLGFAEHVSQMFITAYPDGLAQRSLTWRLAHAHRLIQIQSQAQAGRPVRCEQCDRAIALIDLLAHPEDTRCRYCQLDDPSPESKEPFFIL